MADQSAEHGPRIDDDLDHEVEGLVRGAPVDTRAHEDLEPEPSALLVTTPYADPEAEAEHRERLERSEVARFLRPSALPTDAWGLLEIAREEHAPDPVLTELGRLPTGATFATMREVWEALGHPVELRAGADADEPAAPVEPAPVRPLRPEPATGAPSGPASVEESRLHPVRGAIGFGLELVRAALSTAERAVAEIQERVER